MVIVLLGRLIFDLVVKIGNFIEFMIKVECYVKNVSNNIVDSFGIVSVVVKVLGVVVVGIFVGGVVLFVN